MKLYLMLFSMLFLCSCPWSNKEDAIELAEVNAPQDYKDNPRAQASFRRLTENGFPTDHQLVEEINSPGPAIDHNCIDYTRAPTAVTRDGKWNIDNEEREALIGQIIRDGLSGRAFTKMNFNGKNYKVLNDSPKLEDGTHVAMTFPEAKMVADAWGCKLPTAGQLSHIATVAKDRGNRRGGFERSPNNDETSQLKSLNEMMNDPRMQQVARESESELMDGHFKWYDDKGRIYGFARKSGSFYQKTPSSAHVADPQYYDYSHGVRLICPE